MTIQERLRRSNFIMLVVPVAIAGILLAGLAVGALVGNLFLKNVIARPRPC